MPRRLRYSLPASAPHRCPIPEAPLRLATLFRAHPWTAIAATAGVGLVIAPFFVSPERLRTASEQSAAIRVAELESTNHGLERKLERSLHEVDRAAQSAHQAEARLVEALATNRDSVAYAQQLEAELRLRHGYAPTIERSAPPESIAAVYTSEPPGVPGWYSPSGAAPELPDTNLTPTVITRFIEVESAESKRVRDRLVRKTWDEVVQRAVIGECKGRSSGRFDGCAAQVESQLTPFQTKASQCMAGNFGGTFYLEGGNRLSPPTNGVTLERGIVVFCDPNLKDGGLTDDQG